MCLVRNSAVFVKPLIEKYVNITLNKDKSMAYTALLVMISFSLSLFAAPPDAGRILNEIKSSSSAAKPLPISIIPPTEDKESVDNGIKVLIKSFSFEGNELISSEELSRMMQDYIGQELSFNEIKNNVAYISNFYEEKGYLASARIPPQDITGGSIKIIILEAKFGSVKLNSISNEGSLISRINPSKISEFIYPSDKRSQPFSSERLNRGILIVNGLPGVNVDATLQAGEDFGETDIIVSYANTPLINASVSLDNKGSIATGSDRLSTSINLDSALGLAERLSLFTLKTDGVYFGELRLTTPIYYNGLTASIYASYMQYEVIAGDFVTLEPHGRSIVYGTEFEYPIVKSRENNLSARVSFSNNDFINKDNFNEVSSEYQTRIWSAVLLGDMTDNILNIAGATSASVTLDSGKNNLSDNKTNLTLDQAGERTNGNFNRLTWNFNRKEYFEKFTLTVKGTGQISNSNLDSSQQISLGGSSALRGYPTSEGSGSIGRIFNIEIDKDILPNLNLKGFYDHGFIQKLQDNYTLTDRVNKINELNKYYLRDYGLGLSWFGPFNTTFSSTWARRIGKNPNRDDAGKDGNGTKSDSVFWLTSSVNF